MNLRTVWPLVALVAIGLGACSETDPIDPNDDPDPASMTYTTGARYAYTSYATDPEDGRKVDASEREGTMTLVGTNLTVQGRSGVALYLDSIFGLAGNFEVLDSLRLQQESGSNDIYRYTAIAQELNLGGLGDLDLGRTWQHEARLNAKTASWFVASVADTIPYENDAIPFESLGLEVVLSDSAVASTTETVTIGGTAYQTTKTTHSLRLAFRYLPVLPIVGVTPITITSVALSREIWIAPSLGMVVREVREGRVVESEFSVQGNGGDISIPIPGYRFEVTAVE